MVVGVTGFGSMWRHRLAKQVHGNDRVVQAVYYNTTGVLVKGSVRQRPRICGYARFEALNGFDPNCLSRMINRVFECAEPSVWMKCNKLLFKRVLKTHEPPACFLVVAKSGLIGQLPVGTEGWRSSDTWLLSFSESVPEQEAMLLMPIGGWIRSSLGLFMLESSQSRSWVARLVLRAEE